MKGGRFYFGDQQLPVMAFAEELQHLPDDLSAHAMEFPILRFERGRVSREDSLNDITTETKLGLKKQLLKGTVVVDRAARSYEIKRVDVVRMLPPKLAMVEILGYLTGNFRYRVKLLVQPQGVTPLEDIKRSISRSFEVDPWWNRMLDFEEFRDSVLGASSVREIIDSFVHYKQ